jgi:hypothetical protein
MRLRVAIVSLVFICAPLGSAERTEAFAKAVPSATQVLQQLSTPRVRQASTVRQDYRAQDGAGGIAYWIAVQSNGLKV